MFRPARLLVGVMLMTALFASTMDRLCLAAEEYYTQPQIYTSRPGVGKEETAGHLGPTGINARIFPGMVLKVETVDEKSPADGLIQRGDVILGVNGTLLKGLNLFVALGEAVTKAQASDGKLTFDVQRGDQTIQPTVKIAVLGAYGKTWPINDAKSKKMIERASAYYSDYLSKHKDHDVEGALAALFLLSTGDDARLPIVKGYFQQFLDNVKGVGDNTWFNGYNGIACAEYFLRTGDKAVLPLLQHYCNDARDRQKFGVGWVHWGTGVSPRYVAGGLMNPAGAQVLTTLLLAKQCPVNVDDKTLMGSLRYFYRFAGHGGVAYGDHRGEGGLGSNGKDGMIAAAMQAASYAKGDVSTYLAARDRLGMSMANSYPCVATGHADEGRGDGIWRGMSTSYLLDKKPQAYRYMMDRLAWWYDLSQYASGAMGVAVCTSFNDPASGAGVMLSYTAPRKTLQITGAPRSKFARAFELPARLWGRESDLDFLKIDNNPEYAKYGSPDPAHVPFWLLGSAYSKGKAEAAPVPHDQVMKNIYHNEYMIRAQAAKTLRKAGNLKDLEQLLSDPDPRVRRAALDGIIDWNYWFAIGKDPLKTEQYTPGMIQAIVNIVRDPKESWYVVSGALFAMKNMPARVINENLDVITPWTTSEDWWLREAAFYAMQGLSKDETLYAKALPRLITMLVEEYHTMPREWMAGMFAREYKTLKEGSPLREMIVKGFERAIKESKVLESPRTPEGAYNVAGAVTQTLELTPNAAVATARLLLDRIDLIDTGTIIGLVGANVPEGEDGTKGFYGMMPKLPAKDAQEMRDILFDSYRPVLIKRNDAEKDPNISLIDSILTLTNLKKKVAGWTDVGTPAQDERIWQYYSFDHPDKKDFMERREVKRFREITMPKELDGWLKPDFKPQGWKSGPAPIGVGALPTTKLLKPIRSDWGDGEFLVARCAFNVDNTNYDLYRLFVNSNQGYRIYLNGKEIQTYIWWAETTRRAYWNLSPEDAKLLKKGENVLAVYTNVDYPVETNPRRNKEKVLGLFDCVIQGLRVKDLEK